MPLLYSRGVVPEPLAELEKVAVTVLVPSSDSTLPEQVKPVPDSTICELLARLNELRLPKLVLLDEAEHAASALWAVNIPTMHNR